MYEWMRKTVSSLDTISISPSSSLYLVDKLLLFLFFVGSLAPDVIFESMLTALTPKVEEAALLNVEMVRDSRK